MSYQPPEDPIEGGPPPTGPGAYPPPTGPTSYPPPGGYPQAGAAPYGYQQPGGYAQPGYQMPIEHPQGTTVLVLGIVGIVACGLVAPVAWYMGSKAIKEIDANPSAYSNRSTVQIGRILGIVVSILYLLMIVGIIVLIAVAAASSSSSAY
jgi:hypothetical protein